MSQRVIIAPDENGNLPTVKVTGAIGSVPVTPNDTTALTGGATKGIYIGGAGDIRVDMANGDNITFKSMSVGMIHPISVTKVYVTGTTATNIVAVY